ncbi:VrrA/YqfQ family protein [Bacillus sp. B1-b2]|uniref:VrrA/YqfQ family protein n=1 Tax=Bacillus sp. B1-b2 TaxID=2653201 RepID=UPI001261E1FB|nr:VrrA/YqfQ family protein [Bacillus sp. B1-b2]KAB7670056.1 hypothetical protein F9279_09995 [Bacillus sp. B1-b2]
MMPSRQRNPFQGPPMGGNRMSGMRGPSNFQSPMGRGGAPMRNNNGGGGGGLLSKILGGSRNADSSNVTQGARSAAASGGGILKTLTNPSSINGFLANSQKFLNTASQLGPMINQYGPMVRNIPAMWKLYRGLKNTNTDTETTVPVEDSTISPDTEISIKKSTTTKKKQTSIPITNEDIKDDFEIEKVSTPSKGASKPKLYV